MALPARMFIDSHHTDHEVLCIATYNYLSSQYSDIQSCFRIHAVTTGMKKDVCYDLMDEHIKELGLKGVSSREILEVVDGYRGAGYGLSSHDELSKHNIVCMHVAMHTFNIQNL